MASLFQPLEAKLADVLEREYGTARTIPRGTFRRSADRMSLLDPAYPTQFDRAYELSYAGISDHAPERITNPYDAAHLKDVTVELRIGYGYGVAAAPNANAPMPGSAETPAFVVLNARRRALEDAERIWRALNWPDNFRDGTTDPQLVDCQRVGGVVLDDLGGGRLVATTTLRVILQLNPASEYLPEE